MSFTSDGKGKCEVDMISGDYTTVMYKYHEVEESSFNDSQVTRNQINSRTDKNGSFSNKSSDKVTQNVTVAARTPTPAAVDVRPDSPIV